MGANKKSQLTHGFALPKAPKRSAVPESQARKFERAAATPTASDSRLRRVERGERISAYVPPEIAEEVRVRCVREKRSVSDVVTELLERWLKGAKGPQS